MWDFLNNLLDKAGFVAVIYTVTVAGLGLAVHALWKKSAEKEEERAQLAAKLEAAQAEKAAAVEAVRSAEIERRSNMRKAFDEQLRIIAEERRAEAAAFASRLETVQERRVQDAHTTVREAIEHIAETRSAVDKITNAMSTLERVLRA